MEPITGIVQSVTLIPGRAEVISVMLEGNAGSPYSLNAIEGEITCNGDRSDPTDLFDFLIVSKYPVKATLYPCVERYGNAMKAEFTAEVK